MNRQRRKLIEDAAEMLRSASAVLDEVKDDEQCAADGCSDKFPEKSEQMEENVSAIEEWISSIDDVISEIESHDM